MTQQRERRPAVPGLVVLILAGALAVGGTASAQRPVSATAGSEAAPVRANTAPATGSNAAASIEPGVTAAQDNGPAVQTVEAPPPASDTEDTGPATPASPSAQTPSAAGATAMAGIIGAVLAALVGAAGIAAFLQVSNRVGHLQRTVARLDAQPPPPPASAGFQFDPASADGLALTPRLPAGRREPDPAALAELLGGVDAGGQADVRRASVALSQAVAELIEHALDTDEKMALLGRAVERAALRIDGARGPSAEALARLVDERVAAALGTPVATPPSPPIEPPQAVAAPPPAPPAGPSRYGDLWQSADRLFRRVGLANVTEEIFNQALVSKKAEILADGSYAQRPDLLRGSEEAQNMAAVLRLAASEWANRSDDVTIPMGYRAHFEQFLADYADPDAGFELIWAQSGESAKDSMHETSRLDGVRHEVVSGVRWPGLRGDGEVYMRAKVAIA